MFHFGAICTSQFVPELSSEITKLGGFITDSNKQLVEFEGELSLAYLFLLHSKLATRLALIVSSGEAEHLQDIKNCLEQIDWLEHSNPEQLASVQCFFSKDHKASLNTNKVAKDLELIINNSLNTNPLNKKIDPLPVIIFYHGNRYHIGIDLSGDSLHERGYRQQAVSASLKETLAASIIAKEPPEKGIQWCIDPCCGSATLLIEAAMQWANLPANIYREHFACRLWKQHNKALFTELRNQAIETQKLLLNSKWPRFIGYDADPNAIEAARKNIRAAGLNGIIHVERRDWSQINTAQLNEWGKGYLITNPPYGKRLQSTETLKYFYEFIGTKVSQLKDATSITMSTDIDCLDAIRLNYDTQTRCFNGALPLFVRYKLSASNPLLYPKNRLTPTIKNLDSAENPSLISIDFANRLHKNFRKLKPWLEHPSGFLNNISIDRESSDLEQPQENRQVTKPLNSYRIYDADLPEFNFAVDCYEHCLLVQEYKAPKQIDPNKAKHRLQTGLNTLKAIFRINDTRVFLKQRQQQKGKLQYQRHQRKNKYFSIDEWDARCLINLSDFLDSGIFLDHRVLRYYFRTHCAGKHFLNLFSYTGTASLQAALGGAKSTTSVDLSHNYNLWAEKNFCLNGLGGPKHEFVSADAFEWVKSTSRNFDLIFVDPPTFSNSKKAKDFSVQTHHVELIEHCMKRLLPSGKLFFSCNFKQFRLEKGLLSKFRGFDISYGTQSPDFARGKSAQHRCWLFQSKNN